MRLYEFTIIDEDISLEASIKTITDVMSTELPELYRKLGKMAENFAKNNGEVDNRFNFISGAQKSTWFNTVFVRSLKPALYNLARNIPKNLKIELVTFLDNTIGGKFKSIEDVLPHILSNIAQALKNKQLTAGVHAANSAIENFYKTIDRLNAEQDDDFDEPESIPKVPNVIAQQNTEVDNIISNILSRIDRRQAGEIRNIISKKDNKLQALQQELARRGINPN